METTNFITIAYVIYLPLALMLTTWVANTLFKNSKVFMRDIFNGNEEIAMASNKLFEIGFYLMNFGVAFFILEMNYITDYQQMIEKLSTKIGGFAVYLGFMLAFNLFLFFRGRKKARMNREFRLAND